MPDATSKFDNGGHKLTSFLGYTTYTPWNTQRKFPKKCDWADASNFQVILFIYLYMKSIHSLKYMKLYKSKARYIFSHLKWNEVLVICWYQSQGLNRPTQVEQCFFYLTCLGVRFWVYFSGYTTIVITCCNHSYRVKPYQYPGRFKSWFQSLQLSPRFGGKNHGFLYIFPSNNP